MCTAADGALLVTGGEDGALFVMTIHDLDFGQMRPPKPIDAATFWDAYLVGKGDLDAKQRELDETQGRVRDLTVQMEAQLRLKDTQYQDILAKQRMGADDAIRLAEDRVRQMENRIHEMVLQHQERLRTQELAQMKAADETEKAHEAECKRYKDHIRQLVDEKAELQREHARKLTRMEADFLQKKQQLMESYQSIDSQNEKAFEDLKEELKRMADKCDEALSQAEDDANKLIEQKEGALYKNKEVELVLANKKLDEQRSTIQEKEELVMRLKKENQDLEKFRYVYEFKIKELQKEIQPRDEEIAQMHDQIRDMDGELESDHRKFAELQANKADLDLKNAALKKEVALRQKVFTQARVIENFEHDLHSVVASEPRQWPGLIKALYEKHVVRPAEASRMQEGSDEKVQEFARQREFLERSVQMLKKSLGRHRDQGKGEVQQKLDENTTLIREINDLRREKRIKDLKIQQLTGLLEKEREKNAPPVPSSTSPMARESEEEETPNGRRSAPPGRLIKGSTKQWAEVTSERSRVAALIGQLEANNREMEIQKDLIRRLRDHLQDLLAGGIASPAALQGVVAALQGAELCGFGSAIDFDRLVIWFGCGGSGTSSREAPRFCVKNCAKPTRVTQLCLETHNISISVS
ncbi:putative cilia- and flagella-associated protein 57 [Paratrimastix pyriformis]|uniref:Cilia- and flagella-associated protein 57 n=1 Tax=Paratrimastix pyriformis TaxID=342808 RepID=A0ABQ8UQG6_9EUKA|nr:putative cilia- and flagella-associated protein 57 [Paratrimastix pyriformis]